MTADGHPGRGLQGVEIGERFVTRGRTITEADVVSFASLTGDWHPQHADATWAQESRFGERIAHGMLVFSYALGLAPLDPERVVALRRVGDVVFKRPVFIGDTIRVEGRIAEVRPLDAELSLVSMQWKIVNQSGAAAARATVEVLWRRGDAAAPVGDGAAADRKDGPARRPVFL